jgi:hypothetical protein
MYSIADDNFIDTYSERHIYLLLRVSIFPRDIQLPFSFSENILFFVRHMRRIKMNN